MPDSSSSSSSTSSSSGGGPNPNPQSSINQAMAEAISRAEGIARTAQGGAYAAALVPFGFNAAYLTAIVTGAAAARSMQTTALAADAEESGEVDVQAGRRKVLVGYMQQAQAWARAAFFFSNPARLAVYHIGEDLDGNLPSLGQFSLDIKTSGVADALAGFTPAFLTAYNATRASLFGPETPPAGPEPDDEAVDVRATLAGDVEELTHQAMRILFAVDGLWPYGREGSAGPRHAFGLPPDRPYAPAQPEGPLDPPMG